MTRDDIEREHNRLGYNIGWRFITCPEGIFWNASVILVGLNPGGRKHHGPDWSSEDGNAHWVESWGGMPAGTDPLQQQVQRMVDMLGLTREEIGSAQFVPFRSNSWSELAHRDEAVAFSRRLWSWALERTKATTFICLGKAVTGIEIARLLQACHVHSFDVGWGTQTAERYEAQDGRAVVALPHLGRFRLFGRRESQAGLRAALTG